VDVRRFLTSVLAWDSGGYVTVHWYRKDHQRWFGRSHRTIDDVLVTVADIETQGDFDVYFCLSTQCENRGSRSRKNARALRSVFIDLDVDPNDPKKYPSVKDALEALIKFCRILEIPVPSYLVRSGGGLHAYWASDRDLTVEEWQPFANALKTAAIASELKIDRAVTGDAARILRFPGTFNRKLDTPRPVQLIENCNGVQHDFAQMFQKIFDHFPQSDSRLKSPHKKIETAESFKHLDPQHTLNDGIVVHGAPELPFAPIREGCAWLRDIHDTGGKDYDNPHWHLAVLCATFLEDGNDLAHAFSKEWHDYTPAETEELWERKLYDRKVKNLGWPYCKTIEEDLGCTFCKDCERRKKGKSPLSIGYEFVLDEVRDAEMKELGGKRPYELRLPEGFCLDQQDRLCAFTPTVEKNNKVVAAPRLLWLWSNRIEPPKLETQDNIGGVSFMVQATAVNRNEVFLSTMTVLTDQGLIKTLTSKGINVNADKEAKLMIEKFATSWLDKLNIEDTPAVRDLSMGWRHENGEIVGFVYGGFFYHQDGTVVPVVGGSDDEFRSWYTPVGKREVWIEAARLLTNRKRPELDVIIAAAFAAPLTVFAGTLYRPVLVVWGEPGTSKSTAQQVASALWGHPKQTRESLNSTTKSILGRLGRTKNLPGWWDDVQDDRHLEALFNTLFVASEGAEGGRLNTDATYKVRLQWQTILVACANASFVEFLTRKQKSTTAGMRRVFEVEFNKHPDEPGMINSLDAGKIVARLEHNYGMIGTEYATFLGRNHKQVSELVHRTIERINAKVNATADESYWSGLCGVLLAGAMLSRQFGTEIGLQRMEEFLVRIFLHNRRIRATEGTEAGSYDHTEHAITGFLNEYFGCGNYIATANMYMNRHTRMHVIAEPNTGKPIYLQICRDDETILVSKRALRKYLEDNDIRIRQVFAGLEKHFKATESKLTLGAGTSRAQTQELCFILPVNERSALYDMLVAGSKPKTVVSPSSQP
jgi:Domain of unknown function (DUF927)